jgi:hypothetical protein
MIVLGGVSVLNHSDLYVCRQSFEVGVKLLLKLGAGQVLFRTIGLAVGEQRSVEHDEPVCGVFRSRRNATNPSVNGA